MKDCVFDVKGKLMRKLIINFPDRKIGNFRDFPNISALKYALVNQKSEEKLKKKLCSILSVVLKIPLPKHNFYLFWFCENKKCLSKNICKTKQKNKTGI